LSGPHTSRSTTPTRLRTPCVQPVAASHSSPSTPDRVAGWLLASIRGVHDSGCGSRGGGWVPNSSTRQAVGTSAICTPAMRPQPPGSTRQFGWEIDDLGFGTMIRRPGYGDHLAATVDPGIRERQESIAAPPGFADAIGWLVPLATGRDHWHVTFTVASRDDSAAAAEKLGAAVISSDDTEWTRTALIRDPQGAELTLSQFTPPGN
jgi:Glyoxalase-like domain